MQPGMVDHSLHVLPGQPDRRLARYSIERDGDPQDIGLRHAPTVNVEQQAIRAAPGFEFERPLRRVTAPCGCRCVRDERRIEGWRCRGIMPHLRTGAFGHPQQEALRGIPGRQQIEIPSADSLDRLRHLLGEGRCYADFGAQAA